MTHKILTYDDLQIRPDDVFWQMGYHGQEPDADTARETLAIVAEASRWLCPEFCFFVVRELPGFDMGRIILRQLRGAEAYALFICTAGAAYEAYQRGLQQQGDMLRVYIADALGSVIAEHCADRMEDCLQESIGKLGWQHTNRFSPGYCGWHVSQQQLLFPLFHGHTCGVCLTDSSLMLPIKSVSGIIGVGSRVGRQDYACRLCDFQKCYKRRRC